MQDKQLNYILQKDPSLIWYCREKETIDDQSVFEHVLNYGTWEQVQESINTLGLEKSRELFHSLADRPRSNLKKEVKHFFNLYFNAPRNTD